MRWTLQYAGYALVAGRGGLGSVIVVACGRLREVLLLPIHAPDFSDG
jgi:hypothetical protein